MFYDDDFGLSSKQEREWVGQFLAELSAKADLKPKTLEGYAIAFRGIVADIFEIDGGKEKYDHRGGGRAKWIEKIHAVRLDAVTP